MHFEQRMWTRLSTDPARVICRSSLLFEIYLSCVQAITTSPYVPHPTENLLIQYSRWISFNIIHLVLYSVVSADFFVVHKDILDGWSFISAHNSLVPRLNTCLRLDSRLKKEQSLGWDYVSIHTVNNDVFCINLFFYT